MTRAEVIDELGQLEEWYQSVELKLKRRDQLREVIRGGGDKKLTGWAEIDKKPAGAAVQYDGCKFQVQLSERAQQGRIPSLLKVYQDKRVGATKFIHNVTMALGALRELIPTADKEGLILTEQTGSRKINGVIPLPKK